MITDLTLPYIVTVAVFFATPPGPSQALMIANSLTHGWRRSVATATGDLTANAFQMTAAGFGLAAVVTASASALEIVKWAGVAYLAWVAIKVLRAPPAEIGGAAARPSPWRLYRQGFLTSAANPKAVVFFAALFPQFIDPTLPVAPQILVLGGIYLAVDGVILVLYGCTAERLAPSLKRAGHRWLNRVSGSMMLLAAALLASRDVEIAEAR